MSRKNSIILFFVNVFLIYVCPFCETLHKLIETKTESMYFIHIRSIYPALMSGKTPPQNSAKNKEVRWGSTAHKSPIGEG